MKDKFELKKDICTPDYYIRAGTKKTKKQWQKLFPYAFTFRSNEWFIDLKVKKKTNVGVVVNDIVDGVFLKTGLHSMTYKDAAIESIGIYSEIHNALHQQVLQEADEKIKEILQSIKASLDLEGAMIDNSSSIIYSNINKIAKEENIKL